MIPLRQSTATAVLIGPFLDSTDMSAETSLTVASIDVDVYKFSNTHPLTKTDVTPAASASSNDMAHVANGWYSLELTTGNTDTLGRGRITANISGVLPVWLEVTVLPANVYDSLYGSDLLQVDIAQFGNAAGTFASGRPEVNTTHAAGTAWASGAITANSLASGAITNAKFAASAIDATAIASNAIAAAKIATGAITNAKFAAGAIDASAIASNAIADTKIASGAITSAKFASGAITSTVIADDAITAAKFDESTAFPLTSVDTGSTRVARTGADADTLETLSDEIAGVSAGSGALDPLSGQLHIATRLLGSGSYPFSFNTIGQDGEPITLASGVVAARINGGATVTSGITLDNDVDDGGGAHTGEHQVDVDIDNGTLALADGDTLILMLTAGTADGVSLVNRVIAIITVQADAISTAVVAQIADGVWDEDLTGHTTEDSAGEILGNVATGTPPTAAAIADAVWDEATAGHTTAGTTGERLTRVPNAAAGGNGGLPTVDANNRIAGIAGTITTLDGLDTAQDAQHSTTQSAVADVPTNAELATALAAADDAVLAAVAALPDAAAIEAAAESALDDQGLTTSVVDLLRVAALLSANDWTRTGDVITLSDGTTIEVTEEDGKTMAIDVTAP